MRTRSSLLLVAMVLAVAAPAAASVRSCRRECGQAKGACVAAAHDVLTEARAACASGSGRRLCRKTAHASFVQARVSCKAFRRDVCLPCCSAGGAGCAVTSTTTTTTTTLPPGAACQAGGALPPTGFQQTVHVTSAGLDRTYSLFVPADYDPVHPYPVVVAFHGDGGTGAGLRAGFGLETPADGAAIFAYPDATEDSGRSFDLETPLASNADMAFFVDLIAALESTYCIDPERVFATGNSRGGYFVNFLNCRLGSSAVRAIAPHSGSGPYGPDSSFDPDGHFLCEAPAAAALLIHGQTDEVVPIDPDGEYSHGQWVWANHCADTTTPWSIGPCLAHDACDADKPVVWCAIPGLGHAVWSEAGSAIWTFFSSFVVPRP